MSADCIGIRAYMEMAFPDLTSSQAMVEECSVGLMLDISQQGEVAVSGGM